MNNIIKPLNPSNGSYVPPTRPVPPPRPFIPDIKPILTKQENSDLYLKNFMQLGEALMNAGGNSFLILKKYDDFLRTLASNNIEVTAKYNSPEDPDKHLFTKEDIEERDAAMPLIPLKNNS